MARLAGAFAAAAAAAAAASPTAAAPAAATFASSPQPSGAAGQAGGGPSCGGGNDSEPPAQPFACCLPASEPAVAAPEPLPAGCRPAAAEELHGDGCGARPPPAPLWGDEGPPAEGLDADDARAGAGVAAALTAATSAALPSASAGGDPSAGDAAAADAVRWEWTGGGGSRRRGSESSWSPDEDAMSLWLPSDSDWDSAGAAEGDWAWSMDCASDSEAPIAGQDPDVPDARALLGDILAADLDAGFSGPTLAAGPAWWEDRPSGAFSLAPHPAAASEFALSAGPGGPDPTPPSFPPPSQHLLPPQSFCPHPALAPASQAAAADSPRPILERWLPAAKIPPPLPPPARPHCGRQPPGRRRVGVGGIDQA